jgi:hypothetical protein
LTIQQFRNGLPLDGTYRFLVHDRGGIFAPAVDAALRSMSLQVLKTPVRAPQTNDSDRTSLTSRSSCRCSATPRRPASSLPAGTGRRVNFAEHRAPTRCSKAQQDSCAAKLSNRQRCFEIVPTCRDLRLRQGEIHGVPTSSGTLGK